MKKLFGIPLFLGILSASIAQTVPTQSASAPVTITRADLIASGLTCSMCSNSIYKALVQLPFVEHVSPDVEHSAFVITFRKQAPVDIDALKQEVSNAGFSVSSLTLTMSVHDLAIQSDAHVELGGQMFHFMHVRSQTLNGETTVRVIDKDFLSSREYRQYAAYTTMPCYKTGKMGSTRIYHVTI